MLYLLYMLYILYMLYMAYILYMVCMLYMVSMLYILYMVFMLCMVCILYILCMLYALYILYVHAVYTVYSTCYMCMHFLHVGCYPTALLTNAAVGSVVNVSCDSVHSGFNPGASMTWKCTRHLNWEGEFSSCSFKENWQNPLVLLRYSVFVDLATAVNNKSAFETSVSFSMYRLYSCVPVFHLLCMYVNIYCTYSKKTSAVRTYVPCLQ